MEGEVDEEGGGEEGEGGEDLGVDGVGGSFLGAESGDEVVLGLFVEGRGVVLGV